MRLTKSKLKQLIKEELSQLKEFGPPVDEPDPGEWTDPPEEGLAEDELDHMVRNMTPEEKTRLLNKLALEVGQEINR